MQYHIQKVFKLFDHERLGQISLRDLQKVARELGEMISDEELQEMIERADSDGDGQVTFEDFYSIMTKKTFA